RVVVKTAARIAHTLHQRAGNAESKGLNASKRWHTDTGWKIKGAGIKTAEVVNTPIVHRKDRGQRQVIEVNAELCIVSSENPGKIVGELVPLLRTLNEGVRLSA